MTERRSRSKGPPPHLLAALAACKVEGYQPVAVDIQFDGGFRIWFCEPSDAPCDEWAPYGTGEFTL